MNNLEADKAVRFIRAHGTFHVSGCMGVCGLADMALDAPCSIHPCLRSCSWSWHARASPARASPVKVGAKAAPNMGFATLHRGLSKFAYLN